MIQFPKIQPEIEPNLPEFRPFRLGPNFFFQNESQNPLEIALSNTSHAHAADTNADEPHVVVRVHVQVADCGGE